MNSTHVRSALISLAGFAVAFTVDHFVPQLSNTYPIAGPALTALGAWLSNLAYKNGWLGGLVKPNPNPSPVVPVPGPVVPIVPVPNPDVNPQPVRDLARKILADLIGRLIASGDPADQEMAEELMASAKTLKG